MIPDSTPKPEVLALPASVWVPALNSLNSRGRVRALCALCSPAGWRALGIMVSHTEAVNFSKGRCKLPENRGAAREDLFAALGLH